MVTIDTRQSTYVAVTVILEPDAEDGGFTVRFVELPITTQGADFESAMDNAADAIAEFMAAIEEEGILEKVLRQHGVPIHEGEPPRDWTPPPRPVDVGSVLAGMPYELPRQTVAAAI